MFQGVLFERVKGNRDSTPTPQSGDPAVKQEDSEDDMDYGEYYKAKKQRKSQQRGDSTAAPTPVSFVRMVPLKAEIPSIVSRHHALTHPTIAAASAELRRKYKIEGLGDLIREARAQCDICRSKFETATSKQKAKKQRTT